MNRLQRPTFFDDHAALQALANNHRVGSYPQLQQHVAAIRTGYIQYVTENGNATAIANVPLPSPIAEFLKRHYGAPSKDIDYIGEIRGRSGVHTCPMCGSMRGGTLDHLLPKSEYPEFAIFGLNLVPGCNCNSLRGTTLVGPGAGERILHPYFDDVLGERLLSARFDDLGPVPRISLRLLLDTEHPQYAAVLFHVRNVVERTQLRDYLKRLWSMLIEAPARRSIELRHNPPTRDAMVEILERELDRADGFYDSKNNWDSIFTIGLLDDHVVDWLFGMFSRPGRPPGGSLVP